MMKEIRCKRPLFFNLVLHPQENLHRRCKLKILIDLATFADKRQLLRKREDKSWRGRIIEDKKLIREMKTVERNERSFTPWSLDKLYLQGGPNKKLNHDDRDNQKRYLKMKVRKTLRDNLELPRL
jgi:hypothetical protein